uniref:Uncharacterized protein n=1 Tax=Arundo donax TaxID=35708 RepID=A0A0A9GLV2_ARUDO
MSRWSLLRGRGVSNPAAWKP